MQIVILALGTRGDVQPLLALAVALQQTGRHTVRVIAPDNCRELVTGHGLDYWALGVDTRVLLGTGS